VRGKKIIRDVLSQQITKKTQPRGKKEGGKKGKTERRGSWLPEGGGEKVVSKAALCSVITVGGGRFICNEQ